MSDEASTAQEIDTTKAHGARVYDYLLGGTASFEVDRKAAEIAYASWPGGIGAVRADVREHRATQGRVIRYFAREAATRWPDRETDAAESPMWCGVARKDEGRA